MKRFQLIGLGLVFLLGCGQDLKFNLIVYDSCSQCPLENTELGSLEVLIESSSFSEPIREVFQFDGRRGTFDGLEPVSDAVVTVIGRSQFDDEPLSATTVGLVDLSGGDGSEVVQISVVLGEIDTFISTTNTDVANLCTEQVVPRRGHTATRLEDGRVLLAGGSEIENTSVRLWTTTEIYNPRTGFFVAGPELRNGREGHSATLLADGRVLIAGGESGDMIGTLRAAQFFNPNDTTFSASVTMEAARAYHTATRLADGRVLLAGGIARDPVSGNLVYAATTEVFDPVRQVSTAGPSLTSPRAFHSAVLVGPDTVALIGGMRDGAFVADVEFVTPTGALLGPTLAVPRSHPAAEVIAGRDAILVAGGFATLLDDPTRPSIGTGSASFEVIRLNLQNLGASTAVCGDGALQARRGDGVIASIPGGFLLAGGIAGPGDASVTAEQMIFEGADDLCNPTPFSPSDSVLVRSTMLGPRAGFR
ncbi:MAG: hypothetical protein AAFY60_12525, partial [Myxococcota bacterium]